MVAAGAAVQRARRGSESDRSGAAVTVGETTGEGVRIIGRNRGAGDSRYFGILERVEIHSAQAGAEAEQQVIGEPQHAPPPACRA